MTNNKPEVVAWLRNERGEYARGPATFDPMCVFGSREPQGLEASYSPVVMLSEYEALLAECEKLRKEGGLLDRLTKVLPQLDEALEDLEIHGCHSDRGYVKLKAWYRQMIRTVNALDAMVHGKLHQHAKMYQWMIEQGHDFQWANILRVDISEYPSREAAILAAMGENKQ